MICLRMTLSTCIKYKKIQDRTCRIKNIAQQALSHSQMEAKFNNKDIIEQAEESQLSSKTVYKKARTCSI